MNHSSKKIAVIGLGYVGLPLARLFATKYAVVGFDISPNRIEALKRGEDTAHELEPADILAVKKEENDARNGLFFTHDESDLAEVEIYIVAVPTPIDAENGPDLRPLLRASETVGKQLKKGDIVLYESTVYPGATEEDCVPVLEKTSGLRLNVDFFVGYSPERINPGDKLHTVDKIRKVTSGSTPEIAEEIDALYRSVITAGTFKATSIKVAEAAKVIENTQRDLNIALVNELSKIFHLLDIDTQEVLEAAATKWNFMPFKPGLVGGHCVGIDPYYLAQKAISKGYLPEIILAGRRMNETFAEYIAAQIVKLLLQKDLKPAESSALILGFTFKENCADVRNTKVANLCYALTEYGMDVEVFDPLADVEAVARDYRIPLLSTLPPKQYDAVILAVGHEEYRGINPAELRKSRSVVYDLKGFWDKEWVDGRL